MKHRGTVHNLPQDEYVVFQTSAQLTKQIHTGSLYYYSFFFLNLLIFTTATSVVRLS